MVGNDIIIVMSNTIDHIRILLSKCADHSATEAEWKELEQLLEQSDDGGITPLLKEDWNTPKAVFSTEEVEQLAQAVLFKTSSHEPAPVSMKKKILHLRPWWWAAACLVLFLGLATWLWIRQDKAPVQKKMAATTDLPPGQNGAVLTLADGRKLVLDKLANGTIASEQGTNINLVEGRVEYEQAKHAQETPVYNKMSTPKGRQFQLVLPDGTGVWLNAESSIEFPTVFTKGYRDVTITGEVYFEVAKKTTTPFRVNIGEAARIDVLGTSFNVNAYENEEQIQATLLNGAIKVIPANAKEGIILKPGEQVQIQHANRNTAIRSAKETDLDRVMAWKNGAFSFEGLRIQEVLRQLERWYEFKVVYKNKPSDLIYRGGIDRNVKFSEILEVFREMGLQYEWDGKTLTVY